MLYIKSGFMAAIDYGSNIQEEIEKDKEKLEGHINELITELESKYNKAIKIFATSLEKDGIVKVSLRYMFNVFMLQG